MAIYEADPRPPRGGGLGLLRTAMSLWEHFRDGGTRDQELQRKALNEQAMQANQQQMALGKQQLDRNSTLFPQQDQEFNLRMNTNSQALEKAKRDASRKAASESIGKLPDLTPYEDIAQAPFQEMGAFQPFSAPEMKQVLERTPYAELTDTQKGIVSQVPNQFAELSPIDFAPTWDMNVGVQTGGQKGIATTGTTRQNGETIQTGEPVSQLDAKRRSTENQAFMKQVAEHTGRLQDAFRKDRPFMVWRTADNSFRALSQQLSNKNANGASDLAAAIGFARMLDPDSVVREGERDIVVKRSGGFFDVLKAYANQLTGNGMLSADQRQNLIKAAATEMDAYTQAANNALRDLQYQGINVGVDPAAIAEGPFVSPAEELRQKGMLPPNETASGTPPKFRSLAEAQAAKLPPGTSVLVEVPGQGWEQVTVGQDGNVTAPQTQALPAPNNPATLPPVEPDLNRMVMGGMGGNYPVPPRIKTLDNQRPLLDIIPFNIPLQYPQLRPEDALQYRPAR